jgi:hypothetical protein
MRSAISSGCSASFFICSIQLPRARFSSWEKSLLLNPLALTFGQVVQKGLHGLSLHLPQRGRDFGQLPEKSGGLGRIGGRIDRALAQFFQHYLHAGGVGLRLAVEKLHHFFQGIFTVVHATAPLRPGP